MSSAAVVIGALRVDPYTPKKKKKFKMFYSSYHKNSKYWDMYVWANSVDSDQTALKEQSDQDLHCLPFLSTSLGGITSSWN